MNLVSARFSRLFAVAALALGTLPAGAVTFGGLNVTPRGAQNLNLETGATEMPQGGTVTDPKGGLTMTAARLQLRPGEQLQAQGATVKTKFGGTLSASQINYDLKSGVVTASGNVNYSDARMKNVQAAQVTVHVRSGFVVARGGVRASSPALSGATLVFDPSTMQAVVSGPYNLSTRLGQTRGQAGDRLLLTFAGNVLTSVTGKPTANDLSRFSPYLK
ncbi:hypothetical protein [Deinococcus wulumuqiensis]|uniref:OstA family protein n=1 Tax=Deinococcus wulumuqiensis TaxID=980427 RepID=A0AAV4K374_9DEIO|nr:hypothetical protein [Deinococcus wulumuqiensis]QII20239.1 hypothetical protein G6R31_05235 [Deinococcus wulumuqiensis R12]GGI69864.1 hypothetical protein GCM10008021_32460 [Deinococcus wulumuqiensis]GGI74936.1 hypothetical protein GCM10010914_06380 [Deinococcus wulumuqiensis]